MPSATHNRTVSTVIPAPFTDADLGVHVAPISAFTMPISAFTFGRSERSRCGDLSVHDRPRSAAAKRAGDPGSDWQAARKRILAALGT